MHKLCAMNWDTVKQLLLQVMHSMDKVEAELGSIMYIVLVLKKVLEIVHLVTGTMVILVITVMLVCSVLLQVMYVNKFCCKINYSYLCICM